MRSLPIALCLLFFSTAWAEVTTELSGNLEAQTRHSWNNKAAKDDLFQNWDEENFNLLYGNLNGKAEFGNSRIEANWFNRYSQSDLYQGNYVAIQIFTFPRKLVARDLFKLQHRKEGDDYVVESVLNKFYYEWESEKNRISAGRLYINYGQGEIFNPINPFNQPTALTAISQVAQGNDGLNYSYYASDDHRMDLFVLGDKSFNAYDGSIKETLWLHGEYLARKDLQVDYVLGQDQNRYKGGGQLSYNLEEAMIFFQGLYQSSYIENRGKSHNFLDLLLGYDDQMTSKWHVRVEGGYQKKNRNPSLTNLNERFLPTEYFIALANQYEIHPLVKLGGTVINDIKTGFTYLIVKNTLDLGYDTELDIFGYVPVSKGSDVENPSQKIVTTDIGASLRTFF